MSFFYARRSAPTAAGWDTAHIFLKLSQTASLLAFVTLLIPSLIPEDQPPYFANTSNEGNAASTTTKSGDNPGKSVIRDGSLFIGAYGGAPYTYSSDVHVRKKDGSEFTLNDVDWYGKPFKSPIYYGVRIAKWADAAPFGAMLDFTHSKTISDRAQEVEQSGTLGGKSLPAKAPIKNILRKLEFSHGHNMLTLNGLYRLPVTMGTMSPYIGLGAGISIPHTEIRFKEDLTRTYEYQYTGPAFQALFGLEFRLPQMSLFLEYKFTFADYIAPLTHRNGSWVIQDLWAQFQDWRSGKSAERGTLSTKLASHQIIGGFGMRLVPRPTP